MSVFINQSAKHVILSARKCGLMTLSHSVTDKFKNKSENKGWNRGNPDPHYAHGNIGQRDAPFDLTTWAAYDVTLIIREPYDRYISGVRTVWTLQEWQHKAMQRPKCFKQWYDEEYRKFGIELHNGHVSNWLYIIDNMQYRTIEVVDTNNLDDWQVRNGFLKWHDHKSHPEDKAIVKAHIDKHYIEELTEYLKPEVERYKKWLTFDA